MHYNNMEFFNTKYSGALHLLFYFCPISTKIPVLCTFWKPKSGGIFVESIPEG